jgi:hypothetical protein
MKREKKKQKKYGVESKTTPDLLDVMNTSFAANGWRGSEMLPSRNRTCDWRRMQCEHGSIVTNQANGRAVYPRSVS